MRSFLLTILFTIAGSLAFGQAIIGPDVIPEDRVKRFSIEIDVPDGEGVAVFWWVPPELDSVSLNRDTVVVDGPPGEYQVEAQGLIGKDLTDHRQFKVSHTVRITPRDNPYPPNPDPIPTPPTPDPDPQPDEFGEVARALILYESEGLLHNYILSADTVRSALNSLTPEDDLGGGVSQEAWRVWDKDLSYEKDVKFKEIFEKAKASGNGEGIYLLDRSGRLEYVPFPGTIEEMVSTLERY